MEAQPGLVCLVEARFPDGCVKAACADDVAKATRSACSPRRWCRCCASVGSAHATPSPATSSPPATAPGRCTPLSAHVRPCGLLGALSGAPTVLAPPGRAVCVPGPSGSTANVARCRYGGEGRRGEPQSSPRATDSPTRSSNPFRRMPPTPVGGRVVRLQFLRTGVPARLSFRGYRLGTRDGSDAGLFSLSLG